MSFLTLARGDADAIALLKRAVSARYGPRPVVVESARLSMTTQSKGPLGLPAQVTTTASYVGATHWRWDQTRKLFGIMLGSSVASFDGGAYYERAGKVLTQSNDQEALMGARSRLWGELAMFVSPMTQPGVMLTAVDEKTFKASPEGYQSIVATIQLNEDASVNKIEVKAYRVLEKRTVSLTLKPQEGMQTFGNFLFPKQIRYEWGDSVVETFTVNQVEANPKIPLTDFTMS